MEYFKGINRAALVVSYRKPFLDWIKYVDPTTPLSDEKHDSKTIYLLPEEDDSDKWKVYLKKHCREILENELVAWFTDPSTWPKDISWEAFNEWLDYEMHSVVFDTLDSDIEKE